MPPKSATSPAQGEVASLFCAPQGRAICRALLEVVKWTAKESIAKRVVLVVDVFLSAPQTQKHAT